MACGKWPVGSGPRESVRYKQRVPRVAEPRLLPGAASERGGESPGASLGWNQPDGPRSRLARVTSPSRGQSAPAVRSGPCTTRLAGTDSGICALCGPWPRQDAFAQSRRTSCRRTCQPDRGNASSVRCSQSEQGWAASGGETHINLVEVAKGLGAHVDPLHAIVLNRRVWNVACGAPRSLQRRGPQPCRPRLPFSVGLPARHARISRGLRSGAVDAPRDRLASVRFGHAPSHVAPPTYRGPEHRPRHAQSSPSRRQSCPADCSPTGRGG